MHILSFFNNLSNNCHCVRNVAIQPNPGPGDRESAYFPNIEVWTSIAAKFLKHATIMKNATSRSERNRCESPISIAAKWFPLLRSGRRISVCPSIRYRGRRMKLHRLNGKKIRFRHPEGSSGCDTPFRSLKAVTGWR